MERLESITLDSDEDGFELAVETDVARYRFNVHGMASSDELVPALEKIIAELGEWLAEGRRLAGEHELDLAALRAEEELAVDALRDVTT